jgi:predicted AAA+ superfamily ATPase
LIKSPKILMTDSGLTAHLTGVTDLAVTAGEPMRGALFETYVGQNLAALLGAHLPKARLHFWSVQGRHEVDFVISHGRGCIGIEVKASGRFSEKDLSGLGAFLESTSGARAGILAYNGTEALAVRKDLYAIPLGLLLS